MTKRTKKDYNLGLEQLLGIEVIQNQSVTRIDWEGEWLEAFGKPQDRGVWFAWGGSGSGKSTFIMMLAKIFAEIKYKVFYNLLEEERDDTDYIDRTELLCMNEVKGWFYTQSYNFKQLILYLSKKKKLPKVLIVDSIVYLTKNWDEYMELKNLCIQKNMLLIIVGHAEGKNPRTEFEKSIRFDAKMKIFIDGYLAQCQGRTIGKNGGRFIIWPEGYEKLRGQE